MFLRTEKGIVEAPKFRRIRSLFCRHLNLIVGEQCSKGGFGRISGSDTYVVCNQCGKVIHQSHYDYS